MQNKFAATTHNTGHAQHHPNQFRLFNRAIILNMFIKIPIRNVTLYMICFVHLNKSLELKMYSAFIYIFVQSVPKGTVTFQSFIKKNRINY